MEIEEFRHKEVDEKGKVKSGGAIKTAGGIFFGLGEGCGLPDCHCSDGWWIAIVAPRDIDKKEVRGIKMTFDSGKQMFGVFKELINKLCQVS